MNMKKKIQNVAVYLGSNQPQKAVFEEACIAFGRYLAEHDMTLVFGGSNAGMMKLLADTVLEHGGKVVGVFTRSLPKKLIRHDLTEMVVTENLAERKAEMIRRADAIVALPGSIGTWDELFDALAQKKLLHGIQCPIGVLNINGFYDPLFELLQNSFEAGFTKQKHMFLLKNGRTPEELFRLFENSDWEDHLIQEVSYLDGFRFRILFQDGEQKTVDLESYLERNRDLFEPLLKNRELLKSVQYNLVGIFWDDVMGIEAQTLYNMEKETMICRSVSASAQVYVESVTKDGFDIIINGEKLFVSFDKLPIFKEVQIQDIFKVGFFGDDALEWEKADIHISIDALIHPEKYTLRFPAYASRKVQS